MTAKGLRDIKNKIKTLSSKLVVLETERERITQKLSFTPASNGVSDKIGTLTAEILHISNEISEYEDLYEKEINRLSRGIFEENCLYLHYKHNLSWPCIAVKVGGTEDSIRKMCERYKW